MIVAIHQPNYLPWMGFFHKMMKADLFVLLDNVQFPKESPAARNLIKAKDGTARMLSVSVKKSKGAFQNYNELEIDYAGKWNLKHVNQLKDSYSKAPFFVQYFPELEGILRTPHPNLAAMNIRIIEWIAEALGIGTRVEIASRHDDGSWGAKNDRNLNICRHFNATAYLSGSGAKDYNDEALFARNDIALVYSEFRHPTYSQINGDFVPNLSIVDALFNCGAEEVARMLRASS